MVIANSFEVYITANYVIIKDLLNKKYIRIDKKLFEIIQNHSKDETDFSDNIKVLFNKYRKDKLSKDRKIAFKDIDKIIIKIKKYIPNIFFNFKICIVVIFLAIIVGGISNNTTNYNESIAISGKILWLFINIVVHEIGHAITCKFYNREILEAGIKLNYGFPAVYINTTDICMREKKARIHTSIGGIYGNSILILVLLLVSLIFDIEFITLRSLVGLSWIFILFNLIPFLRLDGYYILSDYLDINNLNQKSKSIFWECISNKLIGKGNRAYFLYYLLNFLFIVMFIYTLI